MFEEAEDCTLKKRDMICSMIMISENATPKNLHLERNLGCNYKKQEYQVCHSITISEL